MRAGQPSQTAIATAAFRAAHRLHHRPIVFDDTLARDLTSAEWRAQLDAGSVPGMVEQLGLMRILGQLVGRARFVDEALEAAMSEAEVQQYVLLGAGLDSFAWRRPDLSARLRVIELDHPDTQTYKRERLRELGLETGAHVELVPVDFERESLEDALGKTGFRHDTPAFFSWMGVVGYLERDTALATLRSVARAAAPRSRIVFDFPAALETLDDDARALARTVDAGTASFGETRRGKHDPARLARDVAALGFAVRRHWTPAEHLARYFAGRSDGLAPNPETHLLELEVRGVAD